MLRLNTSYEIFGVSDPIDMPSTSTVIGELSIEESEALKALLSLGTCVISETGGPLLNPDTPTTSEMGDWVSNPAIPTIPTTKLLQLVSGSLETSGNIDTLNNPISEPSVRLPETQSIPVEEKLQSQNVTVIKDPTPGPSTDKTYTSTPSEVTKKPGALSGEQILEILNNPPKIVLKRCSIPKKDKRPARTETGTFLTHKTAAQYKLRIQTHHLKRKRK